MTDLERIELAALRVRDDARSAANRYKIHGGLPIAASAIATAFDKFSKEIRSMINNKRSQK